MKNINPLLASLPKVDTSTDRIAFGAGSGVFMEEIWKDVIGYEELYQVSNHGRIKSLERIVDFGIQKRVIKTSILKNKIKPNGYLFVIIYLNKKSSCHHVHRLVAIAFCPGYNAKLDVNHKDGNKKNNNSQNLEWCTRSYNQSHAYSVLNRQCYAKGRFGSDSSRSKPISQYSITGEHIKDFDSAASAQRELSFHESGIRLCLHGKIKQFKGFVWKYLNE